MQGTINNREQRRSITFELWVTTEAASASAPCVRVHTENFKQNEQPQLLQQKCYKLVLEISKPKYKKYTWSRLGKIFHLSYVRSSKMF